MIAINQLKERSRKKILLADDDAEDRWLFVEAYKSRPDIELLPVVGSGAEVIEMLMSIEREEDLPDLIVLDQNMPKKNGKQTLGFLKLRPRYRHIAVIIYTTYLDPLLVSECMDLGASLVAAKPITELGYQKMMDEFMQLFRHDGAFMRIA